MFCAIFNFQTRSRNFTKFTKCSDWIIMFFVFFFDYLIYMFMTDQA